MDHELKSELRLLAALLQTGTTDSARILAKKIGDDLADRGILCVALDAFVRDPHREDARSLQANLKRIAQRL